MATCYDVATLSYSLLFCFRLSIWQPYELYTPSVFSTSPLIQYFKHTKLQNDVSYKSNFAYYLVCLRINRVGHIYSLGVMLYKKSRSCMATGKHKHGNRNRTPKMEVKIFYRAACSVAMQLYS